MRLQLSCLLVATAVGACTRGPAPAQPATPAEPCPDPIPPAPPPAPAPPPEPALVLEPVTFAQLPGWSEDAVDEAIPALLRSCDKLERADDDQPIGPGGLAGTAASWKAVCRAAAALPAGDTAAARAFFEREFAVHLATDNGDPEARFTGYYEATMTGSRKRRGPYQWPIYRRPPELVMVHLDDWHHAPAPRRVAGRVRGGRLLPYYTRREIAEGALAGRGLELFWVTDPIDAFFAQVQGSGVVELPGGKRARVGYAAKNGHNYTAIGRVLLVQGAIARGEMSMQAIRRWMEAHPDRAHELMNQNEAFVFFEEETRPGAIGAQGVVLTPERSMAIDPRFIPLSAPIFVVTEVPNPDAPEQRMPWRQLVIAQDTGGAIRGPTRGDLFWGAGERAYTIAGHLTGRGQYYLLLPRPAGDPSAPERGAQ